MSTKSEIAHYESLLDSFRADFTEMRTNFERKLNFVQSRGGVVESEHSTGGGGLCHPVVDQSSTGKNTNSISRKRKSIIESPSRSSCTRNAVQTESVFSSSSSSSSFSSAERHSGKSVRFSDCVSCSEEGSIRTSHSEPVSGGNICSNRRGLPPTPRLFSSQDWASPAAGMPLSPRSCLLVRRSSAPHVAQQQYDTQFQKQKKLYMKAKKYRELSQQASEEKSKKYLKKALKIYNALQDEGGVSIATRLLQKKRRASLIVRGLFRGQST
mmetsp:Transcript_1749/g.6165  ORF Transcript_1749/g.6165 Transcript_1749/m.6165 type:complete len:269 (-) Transcript_1749:104-910(-)|eukprot:CAMPEP_0117445790 /NCGR_PEP_ID=MMETSP0759-20121206/5985_1 /TAXON_ID=63605 /ORGANISM="Percolomonas cosmopolitus, Strain WS" /LENGTH=268 /DNA_ID=CAMNT_0005237993 /DNA_START=218 /DNA_END=1024 /DNA_ORIENTATION=+